MQTRGRTLGSKTTSKQEIDRFLARIYHEAPDDVFELIVSKCRKIVVYRWELGGLNAFRLANKRCKQAVESCTTSLMNRLEEDGPDSLPIPIIQRCRRINTIRCESHNLRSLEGCPNGLKKLEIVNAPHLSDLSPLASCSMMESLEIHYSSITDISVVSSMPLIEVFACPKDLERPSIDDLSPLSSCPRLKILNLWGNDELMDLSPLSACLALEDIDIYDCPFITSLAPLSNLKNLYRLYCRGIDPLTSLLPLVSCTGLKELTCEEDTLDLEELMRRRPELMIDALYMYR